MRLLRTWTTQRTRLRPKPQLHHNAHTDQPNTKPHSTARLRKILAISLIAALCSAPTASHAANATVTLTAKPTAIAGATIKITAHVTPSRPGVAVTLLSGTRGVRKAQTNAQGTAVFALKLAKDAKVSARIAATPSIKSKTVTITVFHRTKLLVDWPTYTISCTNEGIDAYISPAMAGRKVTMQYLNLGSWITEDTGVTDSGGYVRLTLSDNSNNEPAGSTMTDDERIVVHSKGRYLTVSARRSLEYEGCGSASSGDGLNAYYAGDGIVGGKEVFSWDLTNTDPLLWSGQDATVQLEICDADANTCDPSDQNMPYIHQAITTVTGDDSGNFNWSPSSAGNYVVRVSLWDSGQMLTWLSMSYAISN